MNQLEAIHTLTRLAQRFGSDSMLVQGAGGNVSVKTSNGEMLVKASGIFLNRLCENSGWVKVPYQDIRRIIDVGPSIETLNARIDDQMVYSVDELTTPSQAGEKASIEVGMHALLGDVVVHLHPVEINVLLCAEIGFQLCKDVFSDIDFLWIAPFPPGYFLARAIEDQLKTRGPNPPSVIFLQNHGVIVHGDSEASVISVYEKLFDAMRLWLDSKSVRKMPLALEEWESEINENDIFPDTVVFHHLAKNLETVSPSKKQGLIETFAASKTIRQLQKALGIRAVHLPIDICEYILGMSREKHRQLLTSTNQVKDT